MKDQPKLKPQPEPQQVELSEKYLERGVAFGVGLERRNPIVVRPNVFKGKLYLSIRKFGTWENHITHPTAKGIEIPWPEIDQVLAAIDAVVKDLGVEAEAQPNQEPLPF